MPQLNRNTKTALCGVVSVMLGVAVFLLMSILPTVRYSLIDGVNSLLSYPEMPMRAAREAVKYSSNWVLERQSLTERVAKLEAENQKMTVMLMKAGTDKIGEAKADIIPAKVTLRYPEDWWGEIRIDKGTAHGVTAGASVTSDGYLIGRVSRVGNNFAWVELVTSSSFLIAATVDETRDLGVIAGDNKGNLSMLYIPEAREIKNGMTVTTALVGEHMPPGLRIGTVIGKDQPKEGYVPYKIRAGAHMTQLYNVEIFIGGETR